MDVLPLVICTVLALLLGGLAGYLLGTRSRAGAAPSREERAAQERALEDSARLRAELAGAQASAALLRERVEEQEERRRTDQAVLQSLAPVRQQLAAVEQQVRLMERERADQYGAVREALDATRQGQAELRETTHGLSSALRSTTARGTWGEAQLRRVVEAAGMTAHVDFEEQVGTRSTAADGTTRTQRPDMVVSLPGGREIVLDAKAPLNSYLESQEAQEENEQAAWEAKHAKAVRSHVDALANKRYWESRETSPEIVLCFLPVEAALSAALRADAGLLDDAARRGVALVSPVSLLAALKAIALSWRQEGVSRHARELLALSRELHDRLGTVGGHLQDMGRALTRSVESYNKMLGSLESRVLVTARKMHELDGTAAADPRLEPTAVEAAPKPLTAPELLEPDAEGPQRPESRPHA